MQADNSRPLVVMSGRRTYSDAVYLGIGSISTQTVLLRFILASPNGGEFYASLALGGWIAWVGFGAILGSKLREINRGLIWLILGLIKMPLALMIFIYPSFFTGILDPLRFLPLAFIGMAVPGLLYGLIFAALTSSRMRSSRIYGSEALGSVIGGTLTAVWVLADCADFGLLAIISAVEISRCFRDEKNLAVAAAGIMIAIPVGSHFDLTASRLRWSDYVVDDVSTGFSGRWCLLSRFGQITLVHNGSQVATIPDRPSSEELLLWPLLYRPDPQNALLIGYEGIMLGRYLPADIDILSLYTDKAFIRLDPASHSKYVVADPLEFTSDRRFDLVYLNLRGCGTLADYRRETVPFVARLKQFVSEGGVLYISAASDENYVSSHLSEYLSSLYNSIGISFDSVSVIPGPRIGFVCRDINEIPVGLDPLDALDSLDIDSPYFNAPLIVNRLMPYRLSSLLESLKCHSRTNEIGKPESVLSYMRWQNSVFGRSGILFKIYDFPYLPLAGLILVPIIISLVRPTPFVSISAVTLFGFAGMAFEIALLYLFSTVFGTLYLHIGFLIAVFMAGLALGAVAARRINRFSLPVMIIVCAIALGMLFGLPAPLLGLKTARIVLYMISAMAGFAAGGGYGEFADRRNAVSAGATLYGADLYGALTAAVAGPGLLMAWGIGNVMIMVGSVGLLLTATLFGRRE